MIELKIKVAGKELTISPPEYFLDNGSCVQLITSRDENRRVKGFDKGYYIIPKKEWKRLLKTHQFKIRTVKGQFDKPVTEYHL